MSLWNACKESSWLKIYKSQIMTICWHSYALFGLDYVFFIKFPFALF